MVPFWFSVSVVAIFGLIIGSFLNVVIYRFHTGRSLNDRSHCLSCGETLRWYELVPVLSYLALLGRCSSCQSYITPRYMLVEALTALLFVLVYTSTTDWVTLALLATFVSVLVIGTVYDLYHMIIPDEVSWGGAALAFILLTYQSWQLGDWWPLLSGLGGAAIAFLFFSFLWFISAGRWLGLGDAKLAVSLGALCGLGGVFSLLVFSFWIGAILSLLIIAAERIILHIRYRRATKPRVRMKSEIPFAPFLVLSFLMVYFFDVGVLELVAKFYVQIDLLSF